MQNQAVFFFGYLGVFNGIILSIYFFFFPTKKTLSTYLLGALLFMLSIRIGKSVAYFFNYDLSKTILQIGLTACLFIGPFLYFFTKAETKQLKSMPFSWRWQLIGWFSLMMLVGLVYPYQLYPQLWGQSFIPIIYTQWAIYTALSILLLIPTIRKILNKETGKPSEKWLLVVCGTVTILLFSYISAYLNLVRGSYISAAIWFSLVIYTIVFVLLYRKKTSDLFASSAKKYADKKLDQPGTDLIIARLKKSMIEKELFKNPSLKLNDLAKEINVSGHQLSQVLNESIQKNFTLFVNEYRVNEACNLLMQPSNFTIEAIGEEVGFNSKSTFFASFKKIKGITPSAFQQSIAPDL